VHGQSRSYWFQYGAVARVPDGTRMMRRNSAAVNLSLQRLREKNGEKRAQAFGQHFTLSGTKAVRRASQWIAVDGAQTEWLRYEPKNDADRNQFLQIGSRLR
jgi:hypothetical protein